MLPRVEKIERKECAYPVPVITMLTLKLVMPLILGDTVSVSVAAVDCPALSVVTSGFQVKVNDPSAPVGLQPFVVMLSVS